ncbi:MAG: response regulator transcription factor [Gammaproteobacteria bacterium]
MRILIVEDEVTLSEQLKNQLQKEGFAVDAALDGKKAVYMGTEYPFDLAIVDIGLPLLTGIEVIQQWRKKGIKFPILILTARDRWQQKVEGLESGADDYLVKPFHQEELIARVRALIRRASGVSQATIHCGPITLDTTAQSVQVNEAMLELTAYEYKVLEYFILNPGKVISKTELTEHIYDQDFDRDSNVIEVFVGRLRKKLDPENTYTPIETLRGRGYRFALEHTEKNVKPENA